MKTALELTPQEARDLLLGMLWGEGSSALPKLLQLAPLTSLKIGGVDFSVVTLPRENRGAYIAFTKAAADGEKVSPRFKNLVHDEALIARIFHAAGGWRSEFEALRPLIGMHQIMALKVEFWRQVASSAMSRPKSWAGRA